VLAGARQGWVESHGFVLLIAFFLCFFGEKFNFMQEVQKRRGSDSRCSFGFQSSCSYSSEASVCLQSQVKKMLAAIGSINSSSLKFLLLRPLRP